MGRKKTGVKIGKIDTDEEFNKKLLEVFAQLRETMNNMDRELAIKLLYWLNDWSANYLRNEKNFNYKELMRYKRGSIVEADFGFNVGSEQGGLHYAIVLDKYNHKSNKVLLVVSLESLPHDKKPEDLNENYELFLGYGIFKEDIKKLEKEIDNLKKKIKQRENKGTDVTNLKITLSRLQKELNKLNRGSVAQIAQICALSKMRIYQPKKMGDRFSEFRLSDDKMKELEEKIFKLYFNKMIEKEKNNDIINSTKLINESKKTVQCPSGSRLDVSLLF